MTQEKGHAPPTENLGLTFILRCKFSDLCRECFIEQVLPLNEGLTDGLVVKAKDT